ncbi:hypothetical protein [Hyphomonas sp.]|jgi:hypothetical protein|uniref:hypothetical protein n=1 Tax=Hyphomonas sp. TaxID=87 RepID=UPI0032D8C33F
MWLERQNIEAARRQGLLISEILQALDYKGLTAEQIEVYTARDLADREYLLEQALQALPHIAFSANRSADYAEETKSKFWELKRLWPSSRTTVIRNRRNED